MVSVQPLPPWTAGAGKIGAGGYIVNSTVVAPAILFDDFELERPQVELPKQPIVPPPS